MTQAQMLEGVQVFALYKRMISFQKQQSQVKVCSVLLTPAGISCRVPPANSDVCKGGLMILVSQAGEWPRHLAGRIQGCDRATSAAAPDVECLLGRDPSDWYQCAAL